MKFSDLHSYSRAMLTHLAACGTGVTTDLLGKGCVPRLEPQGAASVLLDMRKKGLVFAHQKTGTQQYCNWNISEFGMAVFMSRPNDVPAPAAVVEPQLKSAKHFSVRGLAGSGDTFVSEDRESAVAAAQAAATSHPGQTYRVYELIAVASMPVPQAQITLL